MLTDKIFKRVAELGEVTTTDLDVGDRYKNAVILNRLFKRGLLERENIQTEKSPKYKYRLSDKGKMVNRTFDSYRQYRILMNASNDLKFTFNEETNFPKKVGEEE